MSARISGKVWELDLEPTEKLVLLALADHADHEGNNVRPGNDLLVAKTGLSQQTISTKITKFIELGILEPTKDGRGRGVVREFSIEPERAERKPYFIEREERKLQAVRTYRKPESYKQGVPNEAKRYNLTEEKVQPDSEKVQFDAIAYKEENRHEPSERECDSLADLLRELYDVKDTAGWELNDRFQSIALQLAGLSATVEQVRAFWNYRTKKPALNYFAGDFTTWRASQTPATVAKSSAPTMKAPPEYAAFYKDAA